MCDEANMLENYKRNEKYISCVYCLTDDDDDDEDAEPEVEDINIGGITLEDFVRIVTARNVN